MAWDVEVFLRSLTAAAPATIDAYRSDLANFRTWASAVGIDEPQDVDRRTLRRYLVHLSDLPAAPRTIARRTSALRRYFGWATRTGMLGADPSLTLHAPRGTGRLPRVLHDDQLNHLLEPQGHPDPDREDAAPRRLRDDAVLEVLYGSGLRVAEPSRPCVPA